MQHDPFINILYVLDIYCLPHSQSFPPGGFCTCKVLLVVLISALGIVFKLQKSVLV